MKTMPISDYLSLVQIKPDISKTAHQRIYGAIMKRGYQTYIGKKDDRLSLALGLELGEKITLYELFKDFYGIEREIEQIVGYFRAAGLGGEASRQILFLMGPPGSGKSDIVRKIYWALDGEEIYYLDGCPIREDPMNAVPRNEREKWEKTLNHKFSPSMDLCPECRKKLKTLDGNYLHFKVAQDKIKIAESRYFSSVDPTDIVSYDKGKYLGSVTLGEKEGDPSAFELDGVYHRANRGLLELVEFFKNAVEVHYHTLEATQSKTIESPAGRTEKIFVDEAIIAHSNEPDFEKFKKDKSNTALLKRLFIVKIPYNVRLQEQKKIIEKLSPHPYHLAPQTLNMIAILTVLSRLKNLDSKSDLVEKVKIYDGRYIGEDHPNVKQLQRMSPEDGEFGLDNRDAAKLLERALALVPPDESLCVDPTLILQIAASEKIENIELAEMTYLEIVYEQFAGIVDDCPKLFEGYYKRYLEAIRNYRNPEESPEADLVNTVERAINDSNDKNQLRKIILENSNFEKASEKIKSGVRNYVYEKVIHSKVKELLLEIDEISNENDKRWMAYLKKRFEELGYCLQCLKRVAKWLNLEITSAS